jgi:hypothetical protein
LTATFRRGRSAGFTGNALRGAGFLPRLRGTRLTEAKVLSRQLIGWVHGDCLLEHFDGLFEAACLEEAPTEVVDQLLTVRLKLQCPLGRRHRLVVDTLVTSAACASLM